MKRLSIVSLLLFSTAFASGPVDLNLLDLAGERVDPFRKDATAIVVLFTRTDCPISNRYAPEVLRLHEKYAAAGVDFWLVYPDPDEAVDAIRAHMDDYSYTFDALRDVRHDLVRLTEAEITPEVAVFEGSGRMVYRGRINDRFVAFGKTRPAATRHDLELALDSVIAGEEVEVARTKAVGCYIPELK